MCSSDLLHPILLTSLLEAADAVDSTVGIQMSYLKTWAPRSYKPLVLRAPALTPGRGRALRADATKIVDELEPVDLAYLDPPYNQHRYFTNYHVWETLVRWDAPEHYGVACKRIDARDQATKSVFNRRREMPRDAFRRTTQEHHNSKELALPQQGAPDQMVRGSFSTIQARQGSLTRPKAKNPS